LKSSCRYLLDFKNLINDKTSKHIIRCNICDKKINMRRKDVAKHSKPSTQSHMDQAQPQLSFGDQSLNKVTMNCSTELKTAAVAAASNIPLAFHDRLLPSIRNIFPESKLAKMYHSASTKSTCILNEEV